ncbi:BRO-N domain-containing protein [Pantoea piersonii]|uniref:BRO-N domain-containing protein n=2 Tax=Erwiniaceae TaxID=1903409 RepID=UPI0028A87E6B|nr:P22AR C-terminal domain-containing protein [Pantoea piersonii]
MKILQNTELTFHNVALVPIRVEDGIWLTSSDIAKALGYASSKSVSTIYSRNAKEFTSRMSMVIKMMTNGINNKLREKSVRVFSLRGCHLIAMFATTSVAKEFRRWVLDILEREEGKPVPSRQFADEELRTLCLLWSHSVNMMGNIADIAPLLRVAEHRLASEFSTMPHLYVETLNNARAMLERETLHIDISGEANRDWQILNKLRLGKYASLFGA